MNRPKEQITAEALHELGALLRAAEEDRELQEKILFLARLESFHRTSLVASAVAEMALRGEPREIRAAFSFLATDEGAARAIEFLGARKTKA